jgi:hypothetical protein
MSLTKSVKIKQAADAQGRWANIMSVSRADAQGRWANVMVCILWLCSRQVREIFETFDADGSGEIDVDELYSATKAMDEPFQSRDDAEAEMQKMDKDGSMTIDFLVFFVSRCDNIRMYI